MEPCTPDAMWLWWIAVGMAAEWALGYFVGRDAGKLAERKRIIEAVQSKTRAPSKG